MKRIILAAILFASVGAMQAADVKIPPAKDTEMPSCCGGKVKTSYEATGTCPYAKTACCKATAKVKRVALLSPKAADTKL